MNDVKQIMNTMEKIEYGFLDKLGRNIIDDDNVECIFNKVYYLMPPEELLEKKVGVCWDQVELERKLFNEKNIHNETYFIYIDDKHKLPSHTFLVYYENNKVYWFEHSWYDERGIHEYDDINSLLNDVEYKFRKSKEAKVKSNFDVYIYRYNKPNYNISCDDFFKFIFTQAKVYNYRLENASSKDIERIKFYKLKTIVDYANNLSDEEMKTINNYISENVVLLINDYKNIIYNNKIIGSFLVKNIDEGLLLDEIFIEKEYRNMGLGSSIIRKIIKESENNIYLWVYKNNDKAIKLYQKLGFSIKDETASRYYMEYLV